MSQLKVNKCEHCGAPIRVNEWCKACGKKPRKKKQKASDTSEAELAVAEKELSGSFPAYFPGRKSSRSHLGAKLYHRRRIRMAQRVGLIMVMVVVGLLYLKHEASPIHLDLNTLLKKIPSVLKLRGMGTAKSVLTYATITLTIDAIMLFALYVYSLFKPVPGLMLLTVLSIMDCALLLDPVLVINPFAILGILVLKVVIMLVLMAGYKSAKIMAELK